MKFWDSSAILALLLRERRSAETLALLRDDPSLTVWCLCRVEIASGIARRRREGLEAADIEVARSRLRLLSERWDEMWSVETVRGRALRLLETHPLRAADSLQLAAALIVCEERPEALPFVCLDERLAEAARKEGFTVLP
jgi:uncharacterized protein